MADKQLNLIQKALDWGYDTVTGENNTLFKNANTIAEEYLLLCKGDKLAAAKKFISNREKLSFSSGFITGLGGLITLPVAIPTSIAALLYVQIQIAAVIAAIAGRNLKSDEVKTMVYLCLAGLSTKEVLKDVGISVGQRVTVNVIKNLSGQTLININKKVGFRLLTKFGEKGILNFGKAVPVIGGLIFGVIDFFSAKAVGKFAMDTFLIEISSEKQNLIES